MHAIHIQEGVSLPWLAALSDAICPLIDIDWQYLM